MEAIASAAGVSRATAYLYFAGKPVLLRSLLEQDWRSQLRLFEHLCDTDLDDPEAVLSWVMEVTSGMQSASDSFAIHRAALGQNDELAGLHKQQCAALAEVLCRASGLETGSSAAQLIRSLEAELIVAQIEHFATASVMSWSKAQIDLATPMVVERICDFARRTG